ncbi:MAG: transposase [Eubacteriaceae bacterium]|nr:transposase [Eubacteriaceae bacterium]
MYNKNIIIHMETAMASLVYLKNKANGTTYVYENISTWNKEKKRCDTKRKLVGKLDPESGEVVPCSPRGRPRIEGTEAPHAKVVATGQSLLLGQASGSLGLPGILGEAFGSEAAAKTLTCAYFLVCEGKALSHASAWSAANAHPYGAVLASQRISELLCYITRERQMHFFSLWAKARGDVECMALDITSVSSYSAFIEHARYGHNRDLEKLPQVNMLLVVGGTSGMPIFFEALNGAIKDVSALENALAAIGWMGIKRPHVLLDRGFYSEKNIDGLYSKHFKFTLGAAFTANWPNELVAAARGGIENYANFCRLGDYSFFAITDNAKWKGKRCCRHVYYDSQQAASDYASFLVHLDNLRAELEAGASAGAKGDYGKYFVVKDTPKRRRRVTVRQEEVDAFKENRAGFFVIISNIVKDPVLALKLYRGKDAAEKNFDNLKNALDMKRLRVHSDEAMSGRLFIQFIAQILYTAISTVMGQSKLDASYTAPELMGELKTINEVQLSGKKKPVNTKLSKSQREILSAFDVDIDAYV